MAAMEHLGSPPNAAVRARLEQAGTLEYGPERVADPAFQMSLAFAASAVARVLAEHLDPLDAAPWEPPAGGA